MELKNFQIAPTAQKESLDETVQIDYANGPIIQIPKAILIA